MLKLFYNRLADNSCLEQLRPLTQVIKPSFLESINKIITISFDEAEKIKYTKIERTVQLMIGGEFFWKIVWN